MARTTRNISLSILSAFQLASQGGLSIDNSKESATVLPLSAEEDAELDALDIEESGPGSFNPLTSSQSSIEIDWEEADYFVCSLFCRREAHVWRNGLSEFCDYVPPNNSEYGYMAQMTNEQLAKKGSESAGGEGESSDDDSSEPASGVCTFLPQNEQLYEQIGLSYGLDNGMVCTARDPDTPSTERKIFLKVRFQELKEGEKKEGEKESDSDSSPQTQYKTALLGAWDLTSSGAENEEGDSQESLQAPQPSSDTISLCRKHCDPLPHEPLILDPIKQKQYRADYTEKHSLWLQDVEKVALKRRDICSSAFTRRLQNQPLTDMLLPSLMLMR